ncbi:MAG TPA: hypothetical protein VLV78_06980 [Thermoanaerobaculia bacterium]|nr:hypothetical protein [Thermoanaerobaculia bacterium]
MLDLVRAYMHTFFGYGHVRAKYWFIGLEEGGVSTLEEFERRVRVWSKLGQPPLADIREFHQSIEADHWFRPGAPLERTWRPLIRTRYAAEKKPADTAELKRFQGHDLASTSGDMALLELLPLPSPGRAADEPWIYSALPLPELASRDRYLRAITNLRRDALINLIDRHAPVAVVTYGQMSDWQKWLNATRRLNDKAWTTRRGSTIVVCTHHPEGARSNAHWDEIGRYIAASR